VVLARPFTLQYSQRALAAGRLVADFVDDPVLEEQRKLWHNLNPRHWLRRAAFLLRNRGFERRFLRGVGLVTFVSGQDARNFARRHPERKTIVAPNGVDVSYFAPPAAPAATLTPTVLFLGHLSHPPNADAASYLLRQIAPLIWAQEPRCKVVIVGSSPPEEIRGFHGGNVEITGWVEDVRPRLWRATAVLLPMRIGTGLKNKLLESWAAGRAVVATSRACQGVPGRDGENLLLADTPQGLADAAVKLLRDAPLRDRLGGAGRGIVSSQFTWSAAAQTLCSGVAEAAPASIER
jgi:polysaccharide biosynthesis protein PslH